MKDSLRVAVSDPLDDLPENDLCFLLFDPPMFLDICQEVPVRSIFHDNEEVLAVFKDFK